MEEAWEDSQPDDPNRRHEEGGFITRDQNGILHVRRWPPGTKYKIRVPTAEKVNDKPFYNGEEVVGEFHTHPNPPDEMPQVPSRGNTEGISVGGYPGDCSIKTNQKDTSSS